MGNVLASNKLDSMLWGENHPLGHDVTIEDVENLSLDDVKQFYHDHFNSDNVTIVLSGDISDEILSQIKQINQKELNLIYYHPHYLLQNYGKKSKKEEYLI